MSTPPIWLKLVKSIKSSLLHLGLWRNRGCGLVEQGLSSHSYSGLVDTLSGIFLSALCRHLCTFPHEYFISGSLFYLFILRERELRKSSLFAKNSGQLPVSGCLLFRLPAAPISTAWRPSGLFRAVCLSTANKSPAGDVREAAAGCPVPLECGL